jgi:hypothetical protein
LDGHASIATTRIYLEISDQTLREIYHRAQRSPTLSEEPADNRPEPQVGETEIAPRILE